MKFVSERTAGAGSSTEKLRMQIILWGQSNVEGQLDRGLGEAKLDMNMLGL